MNRLADSRLVRRFSNPRFWLVVIGAGVAGGLVWHPVFSAWGELAATLALGVCVVIPTVLGVGKWVDACNP
jgi:hypothetical protein